jgi:hypothetical protein
MAEEANQSQTNDEANSEKTGGEQNQTLDLSNLSDADFEKIYQDERLYKHPRFKSLSERAKKAEELEKQTEKEKEEQLKQNQKWQELAENREKQLSEVTKQVEEQAVRNALQSEAAKAGITYIDDAVILADRSKVEYKDGQVIGAAETISALIESKPFLKGSTQQNIGSSVNPKGTATSQGSKQFKLSDLQDHNYFAEHEKDIMEALNKGTIIDDTNN